MTTTDAQQGTPVLPRDLADNPRLSRWFRVDEYGCFELRVGKVELGQGILTALAQIAADELGVAMDQVRSVPANTRHGPDEGLTAGSMSIFQSGPAVRAAAANVRALFVAEAARSLRVDPSEVVVEFGRLRPRSGAAGTTYAELAPAVDLAVDADPAVSPLGSGLLVGSSAARVDLPDKVSGRFRYIADLRLPDMLFGRVLRPPSRGARLAGVNTAAVETHEGVHVVRDGSFLAVVAPDEAAATLAFARLEKAATWEERDTLPEDDGLPAFLRAGPHEDIGVLDEESQGSSGGRRVSAQYSRPFLAHASIAPSCGIAQWEPDGRVRIWSHSQGIHRLRDATAQALGLEPEQVTVEHSQNAGSYGHNGADDAAFDAVLLARHFPARPVQVRWSRYDELGWSPFGPPMAATVSAELDDSGRLTSWEYDVFSQGHAGRPGYAGVPGLLATAHLEDALPLPPPIDPPLHSGAGSARNSVPIYAVGPRRVTAHRLLDAPLRSSSLRSLGAFFNVFAIESFMDEAAAVAGADPLRFRLAHLTDERARAVLELAAEEAGWGGPVEDGVGRGIGMARYKDRGAYCAVVAEVAASHDIRLSRLTLAVDVGLAVNPDGVRNQIEGGAMQSASWTLKERVGFDRRRVTSCDWESYPILRFSEVPAIDVHLVERPDQPSVGAGEAAQGPTAGAIGNAVTAAVGVRVRDLPITDQAVVEAIKAAD